MSKNIKLSECNKPGQILLYDGETVNLQYVLRQIYNGETLPKIHLCSNQEQVNKAIEASLLNMVQDFSNGIDQDSYSLGKLDTLNVKIDISKKNIKQTDKEGYCFEIVF